MPRRPPARSGSPSPLDGRRPGWHEIWSCAPDGTAQRHGAAFGITFEDACKHLSCESVDFWKHYHRGQYQGRTVYGTAEQALAAGVDEAAGADETAGG